MATRETLDHLKAMMNDENASPNERAVARDKYLRYANSLTVIDDSKPVGGFIERGRKRAEERTRTVIAQEQEKRRDIQRVSEARDRAAAEDRQQHDHHMENAKTEHKRRMLKSQGDLSDAETELKIKLKRNADALAALGLK
jgi:hypothetical protein